MAEIIGRISSNYYKFSPYNNDNYNNNNGNSSCYVLKKKVSPVMMTKMPVSLTRSDGEMFGRRVSVGGQTRSAFEIQAVSSVKMGIGIGKPVRWWEKGLKPNMKEITSAEDLVDSLLTTGDNLVIVNFFSPGCGGCRALHPKICQIAEMNPNVQFLHVNYEEHKSMCYSLNVHILPFFRFYRGAQGRLCSFSCTNATIKKFKEALAKHTPDQSSLGPPKGLEEKELLALGSNRDLSFTYSPNPSQPQKIAPAPATAPESVPLPLPRPLKKPVSAA